MTDGCPGISRRFGLAPACRGGYAEYFEILVDEDDDWQKDMLRWRGKFDPEEFDAGKATKLMQRGLPNWRNML
jgi:hypothetical protein